MAAVAVTSHSFAVPIEELSFYELRAQPLSDLSVQRRLVELGDGTTIHICLEQLFSDDPQLSESAVLVLGGANQEVILPMLLAWLERYSAGQIPPEDGRAGEPMARVAVKLLEHHTKASPLLRAAAERLAGQDRGTQLRLLCKWVRANSTQIKQRSLPQNLTGLN